MYKYCNFMLLLLGSTISTLAPSLSLQQFKQYVTPHLARHVYAAHDCLVATVLFRLGVNVRFMPPIPEAIVRSRELLSLVLRRWRTLLERCTRCFTSFGSRRR